MFFIPDFHRTIKSTQAPFKPGSVIPDFSFPDPVLKYCHSFVLSFKKTGYPSLFLIPLLFGLTPSDEMFTPR